MPAKREILEKLKRDELITTADWVEDGQRACDQMRALVASPQLQPVELLSDLKRDPRDRAPERAAGAGTDLELRSKMPLPEKINAYAFCNSRA